MPVNQLGAWSSHAGWLSRCTLNRILDLEEEAYFESRAAATAFGESSAPKCAQDCELSSPSHPAAARDGLEAYAGVDVFAMGSDDEPVKPNERATGVSSGESKPAELNAPTTLLVRGIACWSTAEQIREEYSALGFDAVYWSPAATVFGASSAPEDAHDGESAAARDAVDVSTVVSTGESKLAEPAVPTTLMVRNIACSFTAEQIREELYNRGFDGLYNFFYLPTFRRSGTNCGYFFLNFKKPEAAARFKEQMHGKSLGRSAKLCKVVAAEWQGLCELREHFRKKRVARARQAALFL